MDRRPSIDLKLPAYEGAPPDESVPMFRTMAGICGDLSLRAETLGLESNLQAQRHGQQKLHSTLVAAFTGDRSQTASLVF